jgi:hypothetical protein
VKVEDKRCALKTAEKFGVGGKVVRESNRMGLSRPK